MYYHRTHLRDSPSYTQSNESYGSSSTSTTSTLYDGHFMSVGTISCRTPVPQHARSPRLKTTVVEPSPTKQTLRRNKSQSIVYYLWDSSGEEDDSWDYQSNSTSMGESANSCDNSVPNIVSDRSKKIDKLLHELGKPGAIRLY
ncbi:unnamed protein product [Hydatigera taeniaeformis]|uniref:Uncharacterized protein n=1 Tax=Hydatigena taeniaeformis TaxID=6205 RepID=A0A0R3XCE5_HYDTA|nr:unnamed protein product [Hydatigera taeniaeformis]